MRAKNEADTYRAARKSKTRPVVFRTNLFPPRRDSIAFTSLCSIKCPFYIERTILEPSCVNIFKQKRKREREKERRKTKLKKEKQERIMSEITVRCKRRACTTGNELLIGNILIHMHEFRACCTYTLNTEDILYRLL